MFGLFIGLFHLGGHRFLFSINLRVTRVLFAQQRTETENGSDRRAAISMKTTAAQFSRVVKAFARVNLNFLVIVASPQLSLPCVYAFIALL